jgi:hypothetical protein
MAIKTPHANRAQIGHRKKPPLPDAGVNIQPATVTSIRSRQATKQIRGEDEDGLAGVRNAVCRLSSGALEPQLRSTARLSSASCCPLSHLTPGRSTCQLQGGNMSAAPFSIYPGRSRQESPGWRRQKSPSPSWTTSPELPARPRRGSPRRTQLRTSRSLFSFQHPIIT